MKKVIQKKIIKTIQPEIVDYYNVDYYNNDPKYYVFNRVEGESEWWDAKDIKSFIQLEIIRQYKKQRQEIKEEILKDLLDSLEEGSK